MTRALQPAGERWQQANKTAAAASYRPYFELDCRLCRHLADDGRLAKTPLTIADVGAAQGFDPRWDVFGEACRQIGFEPEPAECQRMAAQIAADGLSGRRFMLPLALGDRDGRRRLYITRDPDASSLYRPNQAFFARMPDPSGIEVVGEIDVDVKTLDGLTLPGDDDVDVVKLDVQGAELDVLKGAGERLDNQVLAVIAEASFVELYHDQALFADLDQYLRLHGFQLFDICYRRWSRRQLGPVYAGLRVGQMTYGDVLYLKDPVVVSDAATQHPTKLIKLIALAEFFSLPDYALELIALAHDRGVFNQERAQTFRQLIEANRIVAFHDRNRLPGS